MNICETNYFYLGRVWCPRRLRQILPTPLIEVDGAPTVSGLKSGVTAKWQNRSTSEDRPMH